LESFKPSGGYSAKIIPVKNIPPEDLKRVIEQMIEQQRGQSSGSRRRR